MDESRAGWQWNWKQAIASAMLAVFTIVSMAESANASPARFVYEACDSALPGGGTQHIDYSPKAPSGFTFANTCAQPGGGLSITQSAPVYGTFAFWSLKMPVTPGGRVDSLTVSGSTCNLHAFNRAFVVQQGWPANACIGQLGIFSGSFGGAWVFLGCDAHYDIYGQVPCEPGASVFANHFAATEVDPIAPTVTHLGGPLLAGGPRRGHQQIEADLADRGGGLSRAAVLVNGIVVEPVDLDCDTFNVQNASVFGTVTTTSTPCPAAKHTEWDLDTQAYPFRDGGNFVQVCGFDFATVSDPNRGCSEGGVVDVDNTCTPSPVPGGELLSAQFEGSNAETYTAAFGKGAEVSGSLATNAGDPVPGATLCVKAETIGVDERAATVDVLTTDARGRYRYAVPPGPNRRFVFGYRNDAKQIARDVRFYAHVKPTLKLSPSRIENGERVRLWGKLPGPRPARRVVVLQANTPGSKRWITFRRATSKADGSFETGYRFTSTTRRTRYRFRAVIPRQAGYPWLEGRSKPAKVLVRG